MIRIETYSDKYFLDVVKLAKAFHQEAVIEYDGIFEVDALINTITNLKEENSKNAFLLIIDEVCQGILAGVEYKSMINSNRIFQEIIWFVNRDFRRHGIYLLNKAQEFLKSNGINIMIMAVLENSKTEKIKNLYSRLGFKPMEVHYIRTL